MLRKRVIACYRSSIGSEHEAGGSRFADILRSLCTNVIIQGLVATREALPIMSCPIQLLRM